MPGKTESLKRLEKQFRSFSSGVPKDYWIDHLKRIKAMIDQVLEEEGAFGAAEE